VAQSLVLVVTLEVRRRAAAEFHRYETEAAAIMRTYGGRIERVIELDSEPDAENFREIHVVTFPDAESLDSYRLDPRLTVLAPLRKGAIAHTQIARGRDGSLYS
jgi:uncharacterized protein (DUF1330 family)